MSNFNPSAALSLCADNQLCKTICPFESTQEKKEMCAKRQDCKANQNQLDSKYQRLDHKCSENSISPYFHNKLSTFTSNVKCTTISPSKMDKDEPSSCNSCT